MPNTTLQPTEDHGFRRDLITFGTRKTRPERVNAEERSRKGTFGQINEVVVTSHNRPPGQKHEHLSFFTRFGTN